MRLLKGGATSGVPYTGATADLNLGAYKITSTGVIDSSLTVSQILATNGSKQLVSLAVATYPSLAELALIKGFTASMKIKTSLWPHGAEVTRATTLNAETYYFVIKALETATWSGVMLDVAAVGAIPANLRAQLYNAAGNIIGAAQAAVTVSAGGGIKVPFAPTAVTETTIYVLGVEGSASNTNFRASNASDNNTATNRTGAATLGATVPTGTATAVRLVGNLY